MKENKYKYLVKNTGFLAISSFSSRILVFLLVPFYTSILSTSEYGIFDLASTTAQLLMPILTLNIYEGVTRFLMQEEKDPKSIISVGMKYITIGSVLFAFFILINSLFKIMPMFFGYEGLLFLYYVSNLFYQFSVQCAKGLEMVKYMGTAGVISTFVTIVANILLLTVCEMRLKGFFLSYILGQGIAAIYLSRKVQLYKYLNFHIEISLQNKIISYSVPLILNTIGWWINNVSDRYIVTWLCGVSVNGIYSVAYKIPSILSTFQAIFTQSWQISAIKEYKREGYKKFYTNMLEVINFIVSIACMFLILLTRLIAKILYSKEFYEAWGFVPFLLLATVFSSAAGMVGPILSAKNDTKILGSSTLLGALSNVLLNIVLIKKLGTQGAAVATAISSFLIFEFRYMAVKDEFENINLKKIVGLWIIISIQCLLMIEGYAYGTQILLIILALLIYKKSVSQIVKKFIFR